MIARHKKPRHDLIVVLHSKSCDAAEKVVARLLKTRDHRGGDSTVTMEPHITTISCSSTCSMVTDFCGKFLEISCLKLYMIVSGDQNQVTSHD